jgi:hypothetical protein
MPDSDRPADPLNQVLNGRSAPFVPVAPVYEGLGPLEFHRMELWWRRWRERLEAAGADLLAVEHEACLEVELGIEREIVDRWYPPPAWLTLRTNLTAEETAGCAVVRQGDDLFWLDREGQATWIPPNRVAYHEAQAADHSMPYADLWEQGLRGDRLDEIAVEPSHRLSAIPEPDAKQVDDVAGGERYEVARALLQRHPGQLPLYCTASSPYNSLLDTLGFQTMMSSLVDRPEAVHALLARALPGPSARLAAARQLGVGIVFVEECLASADLISPAMYREFVFPYTRDMIQFHEDQGFRTVFYFSGNLMPLLDDLKQLPFTALSFEEDRKNYGIDLAEVRRAMGPDRVLFGNVDAPFLERASDEELVAEVRRQIEVGGPDGNFVVSVGSPFTPGTTLERVRLFCESTQHIMTGTG